MANKPTRAPIRVSQEWEHHIHRKAQFLATAVVKHVEYELDKRIEYNIYPVKDTRSNEDISLSLQHSIMRSLTVSLDGGIIYGSNLA